jgi:hypothetical protein
VIGRGLFQPVDGHGLHAVQGKVKLNAYVALLKLRVTHR